VNTPFPITTHGLDSTLTPVARKQPKAGPWRRCTTYLRARVVERDGTTCFYCATVLGGTRPATLDHLYPKRLRPSTSPDALVLACEPCNRVKGRHKPSRLLRTLGHPCPRPLGRWLFEAPVSEVRNYLTPLLRHRFAPGLEPQTTQ